MPTLWRPANAHLSAIAAGLLALLLLLCPTARAQATPATPFLPALAEAEALLGRTITLRVDWLAERGGWAFLLSRMVEADGSPLDLRGTPLEEAAAAGGASNVFCALLHLEQAGWTVVASCLGVTDVAWEGWDREHGAPTELLDLSAAAHDPPLGDWQALGEARALALHLAILPEHCREAWARLDEEARSATSYPLRIGEDGAAREALLLQWPCSQGATNLGSVFYLADRYGTVSQLSFPMPTFEVVHAEGDPQGEVVSIDLVGSSETLELMNARFDPDAWVMEARETWRGLGDAYTLARWGWRHGGFQLMYLSVDAALDGEDDPWVLVDQDIW